MFEGVEFPEELADLQGALRCQLAMTQHMSSASPWSLLHLAVMASCHAEHPQTPPPPPPNLSFVANEGPSSSRRMFACKLMGCYQSGVCPSA